MTPAAQIWSAGFLPPARGLGDVEKQKYTQLAVSAASTAVSALPAAGILGAAAATGIGAALVGVGLALRAIFGRRGPQQKIETSKAADQAEAILRDSRDMYLAEPVRTKTLQEAFLATFDDTWAQLVAYCSNPAEGEPGRRCIVERQRGGVAPWCPKPGNVGCDWFILYRDPIANDPGVVEDDAGGGGDAAVLGVSSSTWLYLGLAAAALLLFSVVAE